MDKRRAVTMMTNETLPDAVGAQVERGVGRLEPERRECDAPVCPWCDRQGWDTCGSYYDTYTCEARL